MQNELRSLLKELVTEFSVKQSEFLILIHQRRAYKYGMYAHKGIYRNGGNNMMSESFCIDMRMVQHLMNDFLKNFESARKIHQLVNRYQLWHHEDELDSNVTHFPSIIGSVAGGFLSRIYDLHNGQFVISDQSFDLAFEELVEFLEKDTLDYNLLISLEGPKGQFEQLVIDEHCEILRASHELAKKFSIWYTDSSHYSVEMYEGDFVLKLKFKIPKIYSNSDKSLPKLSLHLIEAAAINKYKRVMTLAFSGPVYFGKRLKFSRDWPVVQTNGIGPYITGKSYRSHQKADSITPDGVKLMRSYLSAFCEFDFESFDKKIIYAFDWFSKAKNQTDITNKVINLSISFEFLINTTNSDVTLQLCLKIIKLLDEQNRDETIYTKLKSFYNLRSKVIHGNDNVDSTPANIELVDWTEMIIQKAMIRVMKLNRLYSYTMIDKALTKSLHVAMPLDLLLADSAIKAVK